MKEFTLNMVISNCKEGVTEDQVLSKFIQFVESNGWCTGGTVREITEEDLDDTII